MTVLSTTTNKDLTDYNSDLVTFSKECHGMEEVKLLKYEYKWFISRKGETCSCGFRCLERWNIEDLGFSEPEDWSPEEQDDINATHEIVELIMEILNESNKIDTVTSWQQDEESNLELIGDIEVNITEIGIKRFRFFDAHRFEYIN